MKNMLKIFGKGILKNPGDQLNAHITKTGRQVLKLNTDSGLKKHSIVRYPKTGTIVEIKSIRKK